MIDTTRFILKPITIADANANYLSWLNIKTSSYIDYAKQNPKLDDLKQYIQEKSNQKEVLFLGIFAKYNNQHIGNIKYEPIDFDKKQATMGILIGDKNWRGKGVAVEVIVASSNHLKQNHNTQTILLGVDANNTPAIAAYKKMGFQIDTQDNNSLKMTWHIQAISQSLK
ncbi:MAG: GNAT family N-acetyltransferase [Methylococcales symbiont of Iophon sp. n. MRB-2018]|nr:MAG: GNAT family N-acetyltransferase [Methylococcales symbiont of Iophon sp. n. MRB-2018]KAF3980412.1 MAG: GNAT family N-acetyltransferase [Methylococcales symbiont of Iophon sp. n. MRB-2018]